MAAKFRENRVNNQRKISLHFGLFSIVGQTITLHMDTKCLPFQVILIHRLGIHNHVQIEDN